MSEVIEVTWVDLSEQKPTETGAYLWWQRGNSEIKIVNHSFESHFWGGFTEPTKWAHLPYPEVLAEVVEETDEEEQEVAKWIETNGSEVLKFAYKEKNIDHKDGYCRERLELELPNWRLILESPKNFTSIDQPKYPSLEEITHLKEARKEVPTAELKLITWDGSTRNEVVHEFLGKWIYYIG